MKVPLGTRKLLVARGMVVILGWSVGGAGGRGSAWPRAAGAAGGARAARSAPVYLPREKTKRAAKTRLMK